MKSRGVRFGMNLSTSPDGPAYVLPIRVTTPAGDELARYLAWLTRRAEAIVVDGSAPAVFAAHHAAWAEALAAGLRHVPPADDLPTEMGKVGGVLTGVRLASRPGVIVADDDVRYDDESLGAVVRALESADVVRPQNYFTPLPWHASWDTGRILLNRVTGGDWPGTLGVRRAVLLATGGYDGRAMFENLELVRTVVAAGGREATLYDVFVPRRPSTAGHFWSQRVRQAYDEIARPWRLAVQLAVLPTAAALALTGRWRTLVAAVVAVALTAEAGRWRGGGRRVFPLRASLFAPLWLAERAMAAWLAIAARLFLGGVPYRGRVLRHAATSMRVLRARHADLRASGAIAKAHRDPPGAGHRSA
jgi:hypothetical protein